jgi:putative phage-type endonuclease
MTTLSPLRSGRITASRVAGILGLSKYQTRDEVLREMVRQALGAEPEFAGNEATAYGNDHEEDARTAYEALTGNLVLDAQDFVQHPDIEWLGVSPDGCVGADGLVEIKCPMRAYYTTAAQVPHYVAQMQLQMACTGRAWTDFVIWRSYGQADRLGVDPLIVERVPADPDWLPSHLAALSEFHREFLEIVADPAKAEPFLTSPERSDPEWAQAAVEFFAADEAVAEAGRRLDRAKARLKELAGDRSAKGCGVAVSRSERSGSVDWKAVAGKYAPDADTEAFRKATSVVWTVRPSA